MLGLGRIELELVEDARDVLLHRGLAPHQDSSDAVVGLSLSHRGEHVMLARAEAVERPVPLTTTEHPPRDDLGVERVAATGYARDRVDEGLDVADAPLEQIADPVRPVGDEVERVVLS